jgi:hypothetical protein
LLLPSAMPMMDQFHERILLSLSFQYYHIN